MKKGTKILLALMKLDIGGAETHVVELAKELKRRGYEVFIASNGGAYEAEIASYKQIEDSVAMALNNIKREVNIMMPLRGYKDALEKTNGFKDEVTITEKEEGKTTVFEVKVKDRDEKFYIEISKIGGHVLQMNNARDVAEDKIEMEIADNIGKKYLSNIGFKNMHQTYYTKRENILTVNYAYKQDDVIIYADLIKVKIALDDGEILGVETKGYLNCHYERNLVEPKVSIEQAQSNLNPKLKILSQGKAIIPTEQGEEIECYEFKGKVEDKDFLVYINVETGIEENILIILETEGGTLTI